MANLPFNILQWTLALSGVWLISGTLINFSSHPHWYIRGGNRTRLSSAKRLVYPLRSLECRITTPSMLPPPRRWPCDASGALICSEPGAAALEGIICLDAGSIPALLVAADNIKHARDQLFEARHMGQQDHLTDARLFSDPTAPRFISTNREDIGYITQCAIDAAALAFNHELAHIHCGHRFGEGDAHDLLLETEADWCAGAGFATVLPNLPTRSWPPHGGVIVSLECHCPPRLLARSRRRWSLPAGWPEQP